MTKSTLHALLDALPEIEVERAGTLLRALRENDRPLIAALVAPSEATEDFEATALDEAALDDPANSVDLDRLKGDLDFM